MNTGNSELFEKTAAWLISVDRDSGLPLSRHRSSVYSPTRRRRYDKLPNNITDVDTTWLISAALGLLFRYGSKQPVIGFAVSDQSNISTIHSNLVSVPINPCDTASDLAGKVRTHMQSVPSFGVGDLVKLVELVDPGSARNSNPLFNLCIADESTVDAMLSLKTDIILVPLWETREFIVDCNARLFSVELIERFIFHLTRVLNWMSREQGTSITDFSILSGEEQRKFVDEPSKIRSSVEFLPVSELLLKQVARTPDEVCIIDKNASLTFAEAEKRSNQIANYLLAQHITRNSRVGICVRPGTDQILALLSVLKTGAAVFPIDYSLPKDRLDKILKKCVPETIIFHSETLETMESLKISDNPLNLNHLPLFDIAEDPPHVVIDEFDVAYILFTSGSTGTPKGVCMTHAALSNLVLWQIERSVVPKAKTLQRTSIAFDVGFQEILSTLTAGGCLVIANDSDRANVVGLPALIMEHSIERLFLPPVALRQLAQIYNRDRHDLTCLREINVAGEQLKIDRSIIQMARDTKLSIDNQYGPTETHVVTAFRLEGLPLKWPQLPPIGSPIANTKLYLLDKFATVVPQGIPGQIHIGGVPLARGYLDDQESTAGAFIKDPFCSENGSRLYKTGDYARYDEDGKLHFVGRRDDQVKIRGYRVELAEIEVALLSVPGVKAAVANTYTNDSGDLQIAAYVIPATLQAENLYESLRKILPEYMVPAATAIFTLDTIPVTQTGKVNKKDLPPPRRSTNKTQIGEDASTTEKWLAGFLSKELNIDSVSLQDTFIELGGDSLRAIQIVLEIEEKHGVTLPLLSILRGNVASISREVEAIRNTRRQNKELTPRQDLRQPEIEATRYDFVLPSGKEIAHIYAPETAYLYEDIFTYQTYKHDAIVYPDDGVFIDVGANIGLFSLFVQALAPSARIIAIEPAPPAYSVLLQNIANLKGGEITALNLALSDRFGTSLLAYYPLMSGMSSLYPDPSEESSLLRAILEKTPPSEKKVDNYASYFQQLIESKLEYQTYDVQTQSLSQIIRQFDLDRISLLKIDAQKSELPILHGIEEKDWSMIDQIIIEAHDLEGCLSKIKAMLSVHGFETVIEDHPLHPSSVVKMVYGFRDDSGERLKNC